MTNSDAISVRDVTAAERARFGPRMFPDLTPANEAFWTSGGTGVWRLPRCTGCRKFIHPGQERWCPHCLTETLRPEPVSGRGVVFTFTVARYPWLEGWDIPFVTALVELDDQPGLRVTTNVVGVDPEEVVIGMRVEVTFAEEDGRWVPLFRPERLDDESANS
jgi:uncharacterized OB-fold protein